MQKDYYRTLGVDGAATSEEIRRAYRKKALELHPDRNGGSRDAEEAFKEVTEAYAVLGDSSRRAAYDASRRGETRGGFDPSAAFADLFCNPDFRGLFDQLSREFARLGLRFDESYLRAVLWRRPRGVLFGGFVFVGPLESLFSFLLRGSPKPVDITEKSQGTRQPPSLLKRFIRSTLPKPRKAPRKPRSNSGDRRYILPLRSDVLSQGGSVRVRVPGRFGPVAYDVRIPAGAKPGTQLRLGGRGMGPAGRPGDLFLEIHGEREAS